MVQMAEDETRLLAAGCPLDQAEPYGDCLTYGPGRYETWAHWRRDRTVDPAPALRRDNVRHDAVDALFAGLLGDKHQAELFAHHRRQNPRTEWGCQPVACMMVAMVAPCFRWSIAST